MPDSHKSPYDNWLPIDECDPLYRPPEGVWERHQGILNARDRLADYGSVPAYSVPWSEAERFAMQRGLVQ